MRILVGSALAAAVAWLAPVPLGAAPGSCESLSALSLPDVRITLAQSVNAGALSTGGGATEAAFRTLPAFCRVAATLTPTSDSDIKIETWLPAFNWNGKFEGVGNGAFNGSIEYNAMAVALARGYAVSSTDTGHTGNTGRFALGHPEKVIDFGWRSVHEMTVTAKKIVETFYGGGPKYSYWSGCSAGGRQGLKEAERFPADFDGIVAGSPALDWTGRASQAVRLEEIFSRAGAGISPEQVQLVHRAALDKCDAADGLKDGLLSAPERCQFDPAVLQCGAANADPAQCLTRIQVDTLRTIYSPLVYPVTKRLITALYPGSELGWTDRGWTASARATGLDQFRFLVFKDPAWTVRAFNAEADPPRAEEGDANTINALDANLGPFINRGGRLIHYHGWSDAQISPGNSAQYYRRVVDAVGDAEKVSGAYRLFMAPGMAHCRGGEGPNAFDAMAALENWVEHGKAPDQIVASHATNGRIDRTRPLCPYSQVAVYKGSGSIDEAANFSCANGSAPAPKNLAGTWRLDKTKGELTLGMNQHIDTIAQTVKIDLAGDQITIATTTVGLGMPCCESEPGAGVPEPPGSTSPRLLFPFISSESYQVDGQMRAFPYGDTFPPSWTLKSANWTSAPAGLDVIQDNFVTHLAVSSDSRTLTIDSNRGGYRLVRVFNKVE